MPARPCASLGIALVVLGMWTPHSLPGQVAPPPDYARAEQFVSRNLAKLVFHVSGDPHWLDSGDRDGDRGNRFWYRVDGPQGPECTMVDAAANTRRALTCPDSTRPSELVPSPRMTRSPDARWDAFIANYNVYIRPANGGDSIALTTDGSALWAYGLPYAMPSSVQSFVRPKPRGAALRWSPDSKRLAVARWDQRAVKPFPLYSSTTLRPTAYSFPYALPGDSAITVFEVHVLDVAVRTNVLVTMPPSPYLDGPASTFPVTGWQAVKWSASGNRLFVLSTSRGSKRISLVGADPVTGHATPIVGDSSATTTLELSPRLIDVNWEVPDNGRRVVWFSWRDGWGHLYAYNADGTLRNQITSGAWSVEKIQYTDPLGRWLLFTARGREPGRFLYDAYLYRVNLDGSGLKLLTPENAHHVVNVSPNGRYVVDTYSRLDQPPVTVLRSTQNGHVIRELERADIARLQVLGWRPPEVIQATAADGVTEIYGLLYKPTHFDSTRTYPIIDDIYPVPSGSVRWEGFPRLWTMSWDADGDYALAELGFVVVQITGRGTGYRSKAFLDAYQGHMGLNTLPDHVTAIKQLAARDHWIDLDRVGIYGMSGGGFASAAGMLRYPDFYKVGVSMAGNHDNRSYSVEWGEKFQGLLVRDSLTGTDNYEAEANATYAKHLKGKLLLMHGDLDDNVHPANTLRLVDALIAANKDFDMLILPDRGHNLLGDPYVVRRMWDYFVRHLLHAEPPAEYPLGQTPHASP